MPMACGQGETKAEALVDLYNTIKIVIEYEKDYVKWIDVLLMYENNKADKDFAEIIAMINAKYSISTNDIFI